MRRPVEVFWANFPWLLTMAILIGCSGFFSASEAALFSLRGPDRRSMAHGTVGERMAIRLLSNPDRLLSAVLFWNLLVNILYFAIATLVGLRLEEHPTLAIAFATGALITIIFFSEMLPKSVGVLSPRAAAGWLGAPMTAAVRALDPIIPPLQTVNLLSRRLIWPGLEERPSLESEDLERAIELSQSEKADVKDEKTVLTNIIQLSQIEAREWMRPRSVIRSFVAPVSIQDLRGQDIPSGYLVLTGDDGDEITAALDLSDVTGIRSDRLDLIAGPVTYVPWCASIGDTLETLYRESVDVACVVNERGETIGIITIRDIFDAVLTVDANRGEHLLNRDPIKELGEGVWQVDGMTNVRRLGEIADVELPASRNVTLRGVVQETLGDIPEVGDDCTWGPFEIRVESSKDNTLTLQVRLVESEGGAD